MSSLACGVAPNISALSSKMGVNISRRSITSDKMSSTAREVSSENSEVLEKSYTLPWVLSLGSQDVRFRLGCRVMHFYTSSFQEAQGNELNSWLVHGIRKKWCRWSSRPPVNDTKQWRGVFRLATMQTADWPATISRDLSPCRIIIVLLFVLKLICIKLLQNVFLICGDICMCE